MSDIDPQEFRDAAAAERTRAARASTRGERRRAAIAGETKEVPQKEEEREEDARAYHGVPSIYEQAFEDVHAISPEAGERLAEIAGGGGDDGGYGGDTPDYNDDEPPPEAHEHKRVFKVKSDLIERVSDDGKLYWAVNDWPDACPIKPLGKNKHSYFLLDNLGQLLEMKAAGLGQSHLEHAIGSPDLLRYWPQIKWSGKGDNALPKRDGFHAQRVRMALADACTAKGLFEERERVRGRGFWRDESDNLVVHMGDLVLTRPQSGPERTASPGEVDGMVYEAMKATPRPVPGTAAQMQGLLDHLMEWNFERGHLDAQLALGAMGAAVMSGALDWRPMMFFLGDAANGKTTLQQTYRRMLPGRLVGTGDASEAALRAIMGRDAMAISFDEAEADAGDRAKSAKIMALARIAASGEKTYRSNSDQGVNEYALFGTMIFSAINVPKMSGAGTERFCFLKINQYRERALGEKRFKQLGPVEARHLGQVLVGRLIAGWHRWDATLAEYRQFLEEKRHTTRGAQNFGTFLACADLMLYDDLCGERIMGICAEYKRDELMEYEDKEQNFAKWWRHLLAAQPEAWRRDGFPSIGEVLGRWLKLAQDPLELQDTRDDMVVQERKLLRVGLKVIKDRAGGQYWLAVPNDHSATAELFRGTDIEGAWKLSLRHGKPWDVRDHAGGLWRTQQVTMAGGRANSTLLRLNAVHDFGDGKERALFAVEGE